MRAPSIQSLRQIKDVTREDAQQIRAVISGPRWAGGKTRLQRIDLILRTFGVEFVGNAGGMQNHPPFYYCNAGDTYAVTVIKVGDRFRVGCWGDIVEGGNYE